MLSFALPAGYLERFDKKVVGGAEHEELWVPAEVLPDFNARLEGLISVGRCFFGERFRGYAAPTPSFGGLDEAFHREDAAAQLAALLANEGRLVEFVEAYPTTIFLHHPYWRGLSAGAGAGASDDERSRVLAKLAAVWRARLAIPLPGASR